MSGLLNFFNSGNELFSKMALTDYVNTRPYIPEHTGAWFDWNEQGEISRQLLIDFTDGNLSMIPEALPGAPGDAPERDVDSAVPVVIPHFPQRDTLYAASLEGVRQSGTELLQTAETMRNRILDKFHRRHRLMWETSRIGAITGMVINHKGEIRRNWFNEFELTPTTHEVDLSSANLKIRTALMKARDKGVEKLGDLIATRWIAICGTDIHDDLVDHPSFEKAVERWNDGAMLRDDLSGGFNIASDITVVKYSRATVAGTTLIGPRDMYLCPVAEGMYQTRFGPGTGFSDLGSIGLSEYVSPHFLPHDEGVEFKAQTNVLSYVQRLEAIVKVTEA